MKTTNAKTKAFKTPCPADGKDLDKNQPIPLSSVRRPKKVSHAETVKLEIHGDDAGPLDVPDVEYAPPKPVELPYESDVFPDGSLDYSMFQGKNLMRGFQQHFSNPIDENGISKKQKEHEDDIAKALREGEAKILKAMEEQDWSVGDVPETWPEHKQPKKASTIVKKPSTTLTARKAVSALSMSSRPTTAQSKSSTTTTSAPRPKFPTSFARNAKPFPSITPTDESAKRHAAAVATSRTTIGYTKGRVTSGVVRPPLNSNPISRSSSSVSTASFYSQNSNSVAARSSRNRDHEDVLKDLPFLKAFDREGDEGLGGALNDVFGVEDDEEEFVMTLNLK